MGYLLGLDLGTTFTAAAIRRGGGPPGRVTWYEHVYALGAAIGRDGSCWSATPPSGGPRSTRPGWTASSNGVIGDDTPMLLGDGGHTATS